MYSLEVGEAIENLTDLEKLGLGLDKRSTYHNRVYKTLHVVAP